MRRKLNDALWGPDVAQMIRENSSYVAPDIAKHFDVPVGSWVAFRGRQYVEFKGVLPDDRRLKMRTFDGKGWFLVRLAVEPSSGDSIYNWSTIRTRAEF